MNAHSVVGVLEGCDPLQQYNIAAFPVSLCRLLSRAMECLVVGRELHFHGDRVAPHG